jgi:hypothetical protein
MATWVIIGGTGRLAIAGMAGGTAHATDDQGRTPRIWAGDFGQGSEASKGGACERAKIKKR